MILQTTHDGTGDGEGVAEDRRFYYCQNWPDVSVIPDDAGIQQERVFYSPYGQPFGMTAGNTNFDGDFDIADAAYMRSCRFDMAAFHGYLL